MMTLSRMIKDIIILFIFILLSTILPYYLCYYVDPTGMMAVALVFLPIEFLIFGIILGLLNNKILDSFVVIIISLLVSYFGYGLASIVFYMIYLALFAITYFIAYGIKYFINKNTTLRSLQN